jgi:hypothetical protein
MLVRLITCPIYKTPAWTRISQKLRESNNAWAKVQEDPVKPAFHAANLAFQVWHSVCIDAAHPS